MKHRTNLTSREEKMNNLKLNTLLIFSIAAMFLSGCYTQLETVKDDYGKSSQAATVSGNFTGLQVYQYTGSDLNTSYYSPFRTGSYFSYPGIYSFIYNYGFIPGYGFAFGYGYGCCHYNDAATYFTGYSTRQNDIEQVRSSGLYASGDRGNRRSRTSLGSSIQSVRSNSITNAESTRINQSTSNTRGERVADSDLQKRGQRSNSNGVNERQDSYNANSTGDHRIRSRGTSITSSPASDGLMSRKEQRANLNPASSISRRELRSVYANNRAKNAQRSIIQNKYNSVDPETDDFYYLYKFSQALRNGGPQHTLVLGGYSNNLSAYSWENRNNSRSGINSRGKYSKWQSSQNSRINSTRSTSSVKSARTTTVRSRSASSNRSQRSGSTGSRNNSRSGGDSDSNSRSTGSNN